MQGCLLPIAALRNRQTTITARCSTARKFSTSCVCYAWQLLVYRRSAPGRQLASTPCQADQMPENEQNAARAIHLQSKTIAQKRMTSYCSATRNASTILKSLCCGPTRRCCRGGDQQSWMLYGSDGQLHNQPCPLTTSSCSRSTAVTRACEWHAHLHQCRKEARCLGL